MRQRALPILACVAVALAFALPSIVRCGPDGCRWVLDRPSDTDDTRQFLMMWEVSRVSLRDFGQLPSWNPYHCGGVVHYLDPQVPFPGPLFFLLFALVPAAMAIKLWHFAHFVAGALGARRLAADEGANLPEQILAAAMTVACGSVGHHLGGGQLWFTPFLLLPWVLWAHRRGLREPRWALLAGGLLALAALEGGVYPVPLMLLTVLFDALLRLRGPLDRRALLLSLPLLLGSFALLGAVKLVPVLAFLARNPRLTALDDQMSLGEVLQAWTLRDHPRPFPPHIYVWPEYGDYLGLVPVILLACGAALALRERERRIDLGVFALLVWCALGAVPGFSLFGVLHELPIFRSLRVPSRFLYPATVLGSLLAVHALLRLRTALSRTRLAAAVPIAELVLAAAVTADLAAANGPRLQQGIGAPVPLARASREFHQDASIDYRALPFNPQRGLGTPICYGGFDWPVSRALWFGRVPQERLEPPEAGEVKELRWSPNALELQVSVQAPAVLIVDQNFEPGWTASEGKPIARAGLLALPLVPGTRTVRLAHRPEGFAAGLALTLIGAVLCAAAVRGLTSQRIAALRAAVARKLRG